jgi:hypothetical protein
VSDEALHVLYHPRARPPPQRQHRSAGRARDPLHFNAPRVGSEHRPGRSRRGSWRRRPDGGPVRLRDARGRHRSRPPPAPTGWRFERPWAVTPTVYFLTEREWARAANEPSAVPGGRWMRSRAADRAAAGARARRHRPRSERAVARVRERSAEPRTRRRAQASGDSRTLTQRTLTQIVRATPLAIPDRARE